MPVSNVILDNSFHLFLLWRLGVSQSSLGGIQWLALVLGEDSCSTETALVLV
jgi:hypothetical protein